MSLDDIFRSLEIPTHDKFLTESSIRKLLNNSHLVDLSEDHKTIYFLDESTCFFVKVSDNQMILEKGSVNRSDLDIVVLKRSIINRVDRLVQKYKETKSVEDYDRLVNIFKDLSE